MNGTVKWFNATKGYGFILPTDGGKEVIVHITAVQAAGLRGLNEGQRISFDAAMERGKAAATNLKLDWNYSSTPANIGAPPPVGIRPGSSFQPHSGSRMGR